MRTNFKTILIIIVVLLVIVNQYLVYKAFYGKAPKKDTRKDLRQQAFIQSNKLYDLDEQQQQNNNLKQQYQQQQKINNQNQNYKKPENNQQNYNLEEKEEKKPKIDTLRPDINPQEDENGFYSHRKANCEKNNYCGKNGMCNRNGNCICYEGWKGETCSDFDCSKVGNCNGHGICVSANECSCFIGRGGKDCLKEINVTPRLTSTYHSSTNEISTFHKTDDVLVSIVIPVYNQISTFLESFLSVVGQSHPHIEVIIVDDGSNDGIDHYYDGITKHPRVRIVRQYHSGIPAALNLGFSVATGAYFTWTSADNINDVDQIETLLEFLRSRTTLMVYSDYSVIDAHGLPLGRPDFRPQNKHFKNSAEIHLPQDTRSLNSIMDNFIGPSFLYRAVIGRLLGDYDNTMGVEDYDMWMRINSVSLIQHLGSDTLLYKYRVHENTVSFRASEYNIQENAIKLMEKDRKRREFFQVPWVVYSDAKTSEWIAVDDDTEIRMLDRWTDDKFILTDNKRLVLVKAEEVFTENVLPKSGDSKNQQCTVIWFDSKDNGELVYKIRNSFARVDAIFALNRVTVSRAELFHKNVFFIQPGTQAGEEIVTASTIFCNSEMYERIQNNKHSHKDISMPEIFLPKSTIMRVALQVDNFHFNGGLENVVIELAATLVRNGVEVTLLNTGIEGEPIEKIKRVGARAITLQGEDKELAYKQVLEEQQFHIINAHYSIFGIDIAHSRGIKFLQTIHNSYNWMNEGEIEKFRKAHLKTTGYTVVSANAALFSDVKLDIDPKKMVILRNGVDKGRLTCSQNPIVVRKDLGFTMQDFLFVQVASLFGVKGQRFAIQAFEKVSKKYPNAKLLFVGRTMDKKYISVLESLILELGLKDKVVFTNFREDVSCLIKSADAVLMPSMQEGWSLALAEALYLGKPVVTTNAGAAQEQIAALFRNSTENSDVWRDIPGFSTNINAAASFEDKDLKHMASLIYLINVPYDSIVNTNIFQTPLMDHPVFVEELSKSMTALLNYGYQVQRNLITTEKNKNSFNTITFSKDREPLNFKVPQDFKEKMDSNYIYKAYEHIYRWMMQNGNIESIKELIRTNYS